MDSSASGHGWEYTSNVVLVEACRSRAWTVYSRFVHAVEEYRREGITVAKGDGGMRRRHPAVAVAETAAAQLRALASEFGLTPSAEGRLAPPPAEPDAGDPFSG